MSLLTSSKLIKINILDIKRYKHIVDLHIHKNIYKCQINEKKEILITNSQGEYLTSNLSACKKIDKNKIYFTKKILTFAEIALGKAA